MKESSQILKLLYFLAKMVRGRFVIVVHIFIHVYSIAILALVRGAYRASAYIYFVV